jgi:hypothetical protein
MCPLCSCSRSGWWQRPPWAQPNILASVPFYEVIVFGGEKDERPVLVISGMGFLIQAVRYLNERAERGEIPGATSVHEFTELHVSGALVLEMLDFLLQCDPPPEWPSLDHGGNAAEFEKASRINAKDRYGIYLYSD